MAVAPVRPAGGQVDHLVVMATHLAEGVAWCEATLGVTPGPGGEHAFMGTHNRLLACGSPQHPASYLEIIAINPVANFARQHWTKRWFDMENPDLAACVARQGPQLIHWVARVDALANAHTRWQALGLDRGQLVPAQRQLPDGRLLEWHITLREDGQRLMDGCLPTLIQWSGAHPTHTLPDSGVRLLGLHARHPQGALLQQACQSIALPLPVDTAHPASLQATLQTPKGHVVLRSPVLPAR